MTPRLPRRSGPFLGVSFVLFLLVALMAPSAAVAPLGPRGWAPGSLPWAFTSEAVSVVLVLAYAAGSFGVWLRLREASPARWWQLAALIAGALATAPMGSADHTNYAAYGRILLQGGNPWVEPPLFWHAGFDPVTRGVQPPWQLTPSIYGPVAVGAQWFSAWIGQDNLRQVVWVWQWVIVGAWLGCRWALRRLFPDRGALVDTLWTLNPVLFATAVLGAHVDVLATLLGLLALLLGARAARPGRALAVGVLCGLAIGVKITAGVVLLALCAGWVIDARRRAAAGREPVARAVLAAVAGALATAVPLHLWAGPHVFDQLRRSSKLISFPSPWHLLFNGLSRWLGDGPTRWIVSIASAALCIVLAVALWRLVRPRFPDGIPTAVVLVVVLSLAYALGAPYALPWYDQLVWALLPALASLGSGRLEQMLVIRAGVMGVAYVPGRAVGLSPLVAEWAMHFRGIAAPIVNAICWALVLRWAVSGSRPTPPPR